MALYDKAELRRAWDAVGAVVAPDGGPPPDPHDTSVLTDVGVDPEAASELAAEVTARALRNARALGAPAAIVLVGVWLDGLATGARLGLGNHEEGDTNA